MVCPTPPTTKCARRFDALVCRDPQCVTDMLAGQHGEQRAGFGAFAHDHRVGQLRAEQQAPDAGVAGDAPHDVGHPGAGLLVRGHRRHGGLGGGGQLGDHRIEYRRDEFVLVGEAFVEVAGGQAGPSADLADGQRGDIRPAGPKQVQAGGQEPGAARGQSLGGLDAAVRPNARGIGPSTPS